MERGALRTGLLGSPTAAGISPHRLRGAHAGYWSQTPSLARVPHLFRAPAGPVPAAPDAPVENRLGLPALPAREALQGLSTHSQTRLRQVLQVHAGLPLRPC